MSTRERWIVYPLLFLTLGIALKDKIVRQIRTGQVVCRALVVTDGRGHERVVLGSNLDGGVVRTTSARGGVDVSVGHFNQAAGLLMTGPKGNPLRGSILIPSVLQQPDQEPAGQPDQPAATPPEAQIDPPLESKDDEQPSEP